MATGDGLSRRELILGALTAATISAQTPNIDDFFRDYTAEWIRHNPTQATSSRYFTGEEQDRLARQLTPSTPAFKRERVALARKGLARLRTFNRTGMTEIQRVSAELLDWQLDAVIREEPYFDYSFPLEQMNGANVGLVENMTVRYPVLSQRDAENYLAALGQVAARLDEATADAKRLQAKKVIPPRYILRATVKQMQSFADPAPAQNPFVTAFAEKMAAVKDLPEVKRAALQAEAEKIVATQIYPAWKRGIALLESQISGATDEAGLSRLKGGNEAYVFFLHRFTTTNFTPDQIHNIGLQQVARIEGRMDRLLRQLGRTEGTVKERIEKLKLEMQYPNPASDASREQIMKDMDGIIRDAEKRAALLFDVRPQSPVVARPFPTFRENNAAANYNAPTPDGSRPGTFQYPRRISNMTKFGLRSLVYHETVPGHHFQIALQVENKDLPHFRQTGVFGGISALSEGWGLYAERLAAESGWYGDDIEGQLGQLDAELFRARRLVVDTGLHSKHWTRQQGIDYGIEASEVERYTVFPGQACSYMMGELKLIELRDRALKAGRTLREYHNKVLATGTVPLELLEREIDAWIAKPA